MMKLLIVLWALVLVALGKQCAPDMFQVTLLGQTAISRKEQKGSMVLDQNSTIWADYKGKRVTYNAISYVGGVAYGKFVIQDFNKMEKTTVDFKNKKCVTETETEKMPIQCLPDNAEIIVNYTSSDGNMMNIVRYTDDNDRLITLTNRMNGDVAVPVVQTVALKDKTGDVFATQLYTGTSSTFDTKIFNIPEFCKKE